MSTNSEPTEAIEAFYSYAHEDERLRKKLDKQLSLLKRQGLITEWHDHKIGAGEEFDLEIKRHLNSAQIILLLISPDFMASDYCYNIEMQGAIERHERGEARVIPILLRPADWKNASFGKLKPLPSDGKAVTRWSDRDEAFLNIAKGIRSVVKELTIASIVTIKPSILSSSYNNAAQLDSKVLMLIWNVPYKQNVFFTGREEIFEKLHDTFSRGKGREAKLPQALSGLGGVGKTQTAIEYAYRYRDEYQTVLWARAESRDVLLTDFATIAGLLSLPEKEAKEPSLVIDGIKEWLHKHTNWLLILDNVEDLEMVTNFIPSESKGHILLTTRIQAMSGWAQRVRIETMLPDEGALLLLRRANVIAHDALLDEASDADLIKAEEISRTLDGLPLGIDQAGAYIEETELGLEGYFELYQTQQKELLKRRGKQAASHPEPVAATWTLSFEKVQRVNPVAADLLRLCAFLYPDAIPEEIVIEGIFGSMSELSPLATSSIQLNEAIEELLKFSLVRRDSAARTLTIHRLVQAVLKESMNENMQRHWAERAVQATNRVFPAGEFTTWSLCQKYFPHALMSQALIDQWHMAFPEAAQLLYKVGYYLWERHQYLEAEPFLQCALTIREFVMGKENLDVAQTLNLLGVIYGREDKYDQAVQLLERALASRKKFLDQDNPKVAESLHDLASNFLKQGKIFQAEQYILEAIAIRKKVLGLEDLNTARSLGTLGKIYNLQGKYIQAEQIERQVLAIQEKLLGLEHPDVARSLSNLAVATAYLGNDSEAEQLRRRALTILEKIVGREDPLLVYTLNGLAQSLYMQGKFIQARTLANRALKILERTYGPLHFDISYSLTVLASTYEAQKDYRKAESLLQRAKAIREKVRGQDHYELAYTLNSLGQLYFQQSKYIQAEPFFQQALAIYEKAFGPEYAHPQARLILQNYALLLRRIKRKDEAVELETRAEMIRTKLEQERIHNTE